MIGRSPSSKGRLDAARDGRGRLIIVQGSPGSGKSRLAREAARAAARRGLQVRRASIVGAGQAANGLVPVGPIAPTPPADVAAVALSRAAATSPLLLILDDLHAADEATLASLAYLTAPSVTPRWDVRWLA